MLPQLEKTQEIFPSRRDEAVFCCGISREIPPSLLSLERVRDTIEATQKLSRHTRLYSKGPSRVPTQLRKSPGFPSSSRDEGPFNCFVGKGIPAFLSHLKRRRSQLEPREELQGSCHNPKRPRCPNALKIQLTPLHRLDSHPEDRLKTPWLM